MSIMSYRDRIPVTKTLYCWALFQIKDDNIINLITD